MSELVLLQNENSPEYTYVEKYIEKNNLVESSFPDVDERSVKGSFNLNIASLFRSIQLSRLEGKQKTSVEHFEAFGKIMMMLDAANIKFDISNIYTPTIQIMTLAEDQRTKDKITIPITDPVVNHVKNVVGRIDLPFGTNTSNLSIGISKSPRGLSMCMGTNIMVCSNMSIFGDHFMTSFGHDKLSVSEMFSRMGSFIENAEIISNENTKMLEEMTKVSIDPKGVQNMIGDMLERAVAKNYHKSTKNTPFDIGSVSKFTSSVITAQNALEQDEVDISVYDLYNIGTEILTHQATIENSWKDLSSFGQYITERFSMV